MMLEEITNDNVLRTPSTKQSMFRTDIDYDALTKTREEIVRQWHALSPEEKSKYKDQMEFETSKGAPNLKDPENLPARNVSLLRKEVRSRLSTSNLLQVLPLDILDFDDAALELAESLENNLDIREIYKIRKQATGENKNAGINQEEAAKLKNCFSQGRELYLAGKNGSLMVKPLNFFYALTAYCYGVIVLNNPLCYRKDMIPGSHGMSYVPDTIQSQFGGDAGRGTFTDLVGAFPTQLVKTSSIEFHIDCTESLIQFHLNRFNVSLGTLLSMIPEMADYYKLTTGKSSRCHPIEINNANDPRTLSWEFHIGDGETRPSIDGIDSAFRGFNRVERYGKVVITIPASQAHTVKACIFTDIRGKLWYIDNPFFPIILPEIAMHFLITNIYSSIMRYRPDEWGSVLSNEVSSAIALLTRHYFSSFQRKFLVVVLRSISRYIPSAA